jgi:hypothetical protein
VSVTKGSDELWLGVKCQTNSVIAGSRRNNFRVSVHAKTNGGRALIEVGAYPATELFQTPNAVGVHGQSDGGG